MAEEKVLHPLLKWAQRKDVVSLTIDLNDIQDEKITLENNKLKFSGIGGHDKQKYGFEITFYKEIIPKESKQHFTQREYVFVLKKKDQDEHYWPRLLETKQKITYVKTDFNRWRDEDDSDDEANNVNQNFEDMMRQMGDIPENAGDVVDDTPDSDDSDDEDMPDLEEK